MVNIRYAQIRECDISNGEGIGVALFVQGCHFHCYNCFNQETWDFNGGKEWTQEVEDKFIELASRPYIQRISILGGEPLADENLDGVLKLINKIRLSCPEKIIWMYTGYTWNKIIEYKDMADENDQDDKFYQDFIKDLNMKTRKDIISKCDVLVDGRYIDSKLDIALKWRGSSNQRVIDVKQSWQKGELVLWTE